MLKIVEAVGCAYLLAGTVQYFRLLWAASVLRSGSIAPLLGVVIQTALLMVKPALVAGVIATWPWATWNALRRGSFRGGLIEPVTFAVVAALLWP
jgi:hypothetical protein